MVTSGSPSFESGDSVSFEAGAAASLEASDSPSFESGDSVSFEAAGAASFKTSRGASFEARDRASFEAGDSASFEDRVYATVGAFAAGLVRCGVTDVVISPGSRSTALALCLHANAYLRTWVQLDERSAGFFALGQARRTGRPSVLVCTSGTAAANYLPAVIEAHHSGVPMIVCTADRPPELRDWGAAQTIDQVKLYGSAARWAVDLAVAGEGAPAWGQSVAFRAVALAAGANPGPVHLNWPFREPLEPRGSVAVADGGVSLGSSGRSPLLEPRGSVAVADDSVSLGSSGRSPLPEPHNKVAVADDSVSLGSSGRSPLPEPHSKVAGATENVPQGILVPRSHLNCTPVAFAGLEELLGYERGLIVVGPDSANGMDAQGEVVAAALRLSAATAWPLIGEPVAGARRVLSHQGSTDDGAHLGTVIAHAAHLLDVSEIADELRCDVLLRLGNTPTTKPLGLWLQTQPPRHLVLIDPANRWSDSSFCVTDHIAADPLAVLNSAAGWVTRQQSVWCERWRHLDRVAGTAIAGELERGPLLSARVASVLADALPDGALLMASNSLPVRMLDSFVGSSGPRIMFAGNRGASGIDGVTSTALGLSSQHGSPVVLFIGDLALLHDLSALFGAARSNLSLTIVCVDNNGGGIFRALPIADCVDDATFETLFRTPHGLSLAEFNGVAGVRVTTIATAAEFVDALRLACQNGEPGVDLLLIEVDPVADLAQLREIADAVKVAVT